MRGLKNKRAIVTGAGSGIGRATALRLAEEGSAVGVVDICGESARTTSSLIVSSGRTAIPFEADITQLTDVLETVGLARHQLGGIDILVNNTGTAFTDRATSVDIVDWEHIQAVDLGGTRLMMEFSVSVMLEAGAGSIVNIADQQTLRGFPDSSGYAATKGAIVSLTKQAAAEYAPAGIRVNSVAPGTIMTPMNQEALRHSSDPERISREWMARHPLGRFGRAEEVAAAIAFLASDEASFITGHCLLVDGGAAIQDSSD